jgi:hypothetical protein
MATLSVNLIQAQVLTVVALRLSLTPDLAQFKLLFPH